MLLLSDKRLLLIVTGMLVQIGAFSGPTDAQETTQCFSLEFFYDSSVDDSAELRSALSEFAEERTGLILHLRDLNQDEQLKLRIDDISRHFGMQEIKLPAIYGLKYVVDGLQTREQLERRLDEVLTMTAYVRNGCPHCRDAKAFLGKYAVRYPALEIVFKEVITSQENQQEMQSVVRRYRQQAVSLPVLHYCNSLTIGFDREETTGKRVLQTLDYWSRACTPKKKTDP
ncbi:MAG: hypothetical protein KDA52_02830 [Planctomycetaceae bacterium]|nr:hypothetical protein [Planctomycetaceae bacterium]